MTISTKASGAGDGESLRDGSPLCLSCGLCCHGVLHDNAMLQRDEEEMAQALGLTVERQGDWLGFALPCPKIDGARCTIYEHRPSTCSSYRCGLLKRYQRHEVSLAEARPLIAEARRLFQNAVSALPAGSDFRHVRWQLRRRMRGHAEGGLAEEQAVPMKEPSLRIMLLDLFLDRHFRLRRETTFEGPDGDEPSMGGWPQSPNSSTRRASSEHPRSPS